MSPGDQFGSDGWQYARRPVPFDWSTVDEFEKRTFGPAFWLAVLFVAVVVLIVVLGLVAGARA